jgi:hypothetical protein
MRFVLFALSAVVIACLAATAADAAPARQRPGAQAVPKSREALFQHCRAEAFRKFGWNHGSKGRVLYVDFVFEQTEYCVRNGGRL